MQFLEVLAGAGRRAALRRVDRAVPRRGCRTVTPPSIWLPYRGIRKLFHKEAVLAEHASPLFRLAPYIVFGTMVCAAAIMPSMGTRLPFSNAADAIALVGLLATARVFMSLAAMDVGTAFGTLGARREMMVGFPGRAGAADRDLRRVADLAEHGVADDRG